MQLDNFRIDMGDDVIERLASGHIAFLHEPRLDFGFEVLEGPKSSLQPDQFAALLAVHISSTHWSQSLY
ncbi:MAG: hypothetical protein WCF09_10890, partial [Gallionella sp.]